LKQAAAASFDAVIVDGIDFSSSTAGGHTYGDSLFALDFYSDVHRALAPGGSLVQYMSDVDRFQELAAAGFNESINYGVDVWSYPGYGARFTLATKGPSQLLSLAQRLLQEARKNVPDLGLAYLDAASLEKGLKHTARRLKGATTTPAPAPKPKSAITPSSTTTEIAPSSTTKCLGIACEKVPRARVGKTTASGTHRLRLLVPVALCWALGYSFLSASVFDSCH